MNTVANLNVRMPGKVVIVDYLGDLPAFGIENTLYIVRFNINHDEEATTYEFIDGSFHALNIGKLDVKAINVLIEDVNDNFDSTDVEGALEELFTYANNIKTRVAGAIGSPLDTGDTAEEMANKIDVLKEDLALAISSKDVPTQETDSLNTMANNVTLIQSGSKLKRTSKINVTAPYTYDLVLDFPKPLRDTVAMLYERYGDDSGIVQYEADYNNSESTNFDYNEDYVSFDGYMHIKADFFYRVGEIEEDYYISDEIDFSAYADMASINIKMDEINIRGLQSTEEIIVANGDISLVEVETIDSIDFKTITSGDGVSKIAMSFDNGNNYVAWDGSDWISVDITNKLDFKSKGMADDTVSLLTAEEFEVARKLSDTVRFAYYLNRPIYYDTANNDKLTLKVTMKGYDILSSTDDYTVEYDEVLGKFEFIINKSGTYIINYI